MNNDKAKARDIASVEIVRGAPAHDGVLARGFWHIECYDSEGNLKWVDDAQNLVVNQGLDHLLDVTLSGATQITTWYVGLTDNTPSPAAADVMSSHAGWTEFTEYSQATRVTWTDGGVSGQSVSNSGSPASFSVNNSTNGGLGGLFLVSENTKGGTTGTLYSVVAITGGNRVVNNGDTINATYTFTMADDGA